MTRQNVTLTILFADVSGSTRLFETLGDAVAREIVAQCLALLAEQTQRHNGTVIKTIGDEIMCTFPAANNAMEAARAMQDAITNDMPRVNPNAPATLAIRIGLHHGAAILEGGDVFGDAVNVAARMAGLAKGGQIITTRETAESLSRVLQADTRHLGQIHVKGKSEDVDIFEFVWEQEDVTRIATNLVKSNQPKQARLLLRYAGQEFSLDQRSPPTILGRGTKADVVINDSMASREHARIEYRRDKFVLTDQSTNGTYVLLPEGPLYLRREETALAGQGKISLGRDFNEATQVVTFDCGEC